MAFQHIFTSAQMGLRPGSSGYCTVAQSEGIPGDLVKDLERLSTYDFSARNDPGMEGHSPIIYRYQVVQSHSGHYFVVSRISDAGADHTGRTNYLAQHLALDSSEILQLRDYPHLNPAALLLIGLPWKKAWDEMPQTQPNLEVGELFPYEHPMYDELERNGCSTWKNNPLCTRADQAPTLLESPWNTKCFLHLPPGQEQELLKLLNETLWLSGEEAWRYGFTTFLQHEESHENYAWCAVSGENAQQQASGQRLWEMHSLPQASDEALKYKAATGQEEPIEPEPAPEPEVTQPFPVNPASPFHGESPPATTFQPRPQTPPAQTTSQQPPSAEQPQTAEEFVAKMKSLGATPAADDFAIQYNNKQKEYAEFIIKEIRGSDSPRFIKNYERDVYRLKTNLESSFKNISAVRTKAVLKQCIQYYQPIDKIIKEKQKIIEVKPKGGTQTITSDLLPPPPPANGTQKKFPWKKVIVALGLAVAVIFILIKFDWIKDKIKAGGGQQDGNNPGGNNPGGNNPGGNNPGGNNPGGNNPGGTTTNPGDEYRTSPELKAKVDKYFGTGNAIVRLFVAKKGQLILKGYEVPLLFAVLSKDQLNPKPTAGLSKLIEVYQPQSTNGFEGLKWESADPAVPPSSQVELLYVRSVSGNGGISFAGIPKWDSGGLTEPSEKSGIQWKKYQEEVAKFFGSQFGIKVKHNTAIRVRTSMGTEIIYILNNPGIFFDGLFDEAVNKPEGSGLAKLVIDPYLMNRLNQHVSYLSQTTCRLKVSTGLVLNRAGDGREWVVRTKNFDEKIYSLRNPPFAGRSIKMVPDKTNPTKRNGDEHLFQIGILFKGKLFKDAKITVTPSDKIEVTGMRSGKDNKLKKEGNTFVLKNSTELATPFYCWVKPNGPVAPTQHIQIKIELSDTQKGGLINSQVTAKKDHQDAFKAVLKEDSTLDYHKYFTKSYSVHVIRFNRKK